MGPTRSPDWPLVSTVRVVLGGREDCRVARSWIAGGWKVMP